MQISATTRLNSQISHKDTAPKDLPRIQHPIKLYVLSPDEKYAWYTGLLGIADGRHQLGPVVASNRVFLSTAPQPSPSIPIFEGALGITIYDYNRPIESST